MKEPDYAYISKLVLRSQQNDSDAFAELYSLTYNKIYNYACHYLKDTYLAQDAVQEIFISALKNISKLKDPLVFVSWLNQISFHICYDICKKRNTNYGTIDDSILPELADEHVGANPEANLLKNAELLELNASIDDLPPNERQVIIMRYYNNMKIDEIASAIAISKSTVKRYLSSGQANLKRNLKYFRGGSIQ